MYGYEYSSANKSKLSSNNIFNDALGFNGLGIGENHTVSTTAGNSVYKAGHGACRLSFC